MPVSPTPRRFSVGSPSSASGSRSATPLFSLSAAFGTSPALSTPPPAPLSFATLPADALPPPPYSADPAPLLPRLVEGTTYIERARLVRLSRSGINLHSLDTPAAPPPPVYVPPEPLYRHRAGPRYTSEPSSRRGSVGDVMEGGSSYRERARRRYLGQDEPDSGPSSPPNGLQPIVSHEPRIASPPFVTTLAPLSSSSHASTLSIPVAPAVSDSHSPSPPPDFVSPDLPSGEPYSPVHLDSDAQIAALLQTALNPPPAIDPAHPDETYSDRARRLLRERAERLQVLEALAQIEGFVLETGDGYEARQRRREDEERRERMEDRSRRGSAGEDGEETYSERARRMLDERAENFRRFEAGIGFGRVIGV